MRHQEIGGYLELELSPGTDVPHSQALLVNSGRHALELILRALGTVQKLWIPYYTCRVILEPLVKLNLPYEYYHINDRLELAQDISLAEGEYLLYTNYFGIKDNYILELNEKYGNKLIADNAQALITEQNLAGCAFYSPRKFVGVPDGGIAQLPFDYSIDNNELDESYDRCAHLLKRYDLGASAAYLDCKENNKKLRGLAIRRMSPLSQALLQSLDYRFIKETRERNFSILHQELKSSNRLDIDSFGSFASPLIYPYYSDDAELKSRLIAHKVFVATYWPNVFDWCQKSDFEYDLTKNLIAIPMDQRYSVDDMEFILNLIKN
ncbi:MAG: hypothetical protein R3Y56_04330 [Akkermansia sp.]